MFLSAVVGAEKSLEYTKRILILSPIECKRYGRQNSVGVNIVRSLYGVQSADQINKAILVTTGHVTRGARRFVDGQNTMMSVIDVKEIHELIQRNARKYRGY